MAHAHQQHGEFIATKPGRHVGHADGPRHPVRGFLQHRVARGMAMQVVDRLEAVQVDGQEREGIAAALSHGQFAQDEFTEQHAVAQAGQGIVVRQVLGMRQHARRLQ
ncbi:hypothetical protein D3C73_1019610 [compost metagenome]